MKRSQALALATAFALSAAFVGAASASGSKLVAHTSRPHVRALSAGTEGDDGGGLRAGPVAHGSIGSAAPSANAAIRLGALRGDDGSGFDDGGASIGASVAHGSIGTAPPSANAATQLLALGGGDGGSDN